MPTPIRVGILGLTHDHIWGNLDDLNKLSTGKLVAAADPNNRCWRKSVTNTVVSRSSTELRKPCSMKVELDAVYVYGDNKTGVDLAVMAAERGLHVMVEKPMASTHEGAVAMVAAARTNGVKLMINWPNGLARRPCRRRRPWPWAVRSARLRDQISLRPCRSQGTGLHALLLQLAA
jgi:predicted dehydrogenase